MISVLQPIGLHYSLLFFVFLSDVTGPSVGHLVLSGVSSMHQCAGKLT